VNFHLSPNPYQALGLGGRYRHGPSRWCATGDPAAAPQDLGALPDEQEVWRAPPEARSAHRTPLSIARSGTVVSRGPPIVWGGPVSLSVYRLHLRRPDRLRLACGRPQDATVASDGWRRTCESSEPRTVNRPCMSFSHAGAVESGSTEISASIPGSTGVGTQVISVAEQASVPPRSGVQPPVIGREPTPTLNVAAGEGTQRPLPDPQLVAPGRARGRAAARSQSRADCLGDC